MSQDNRETNEVMDHNYDGIEEYDNPLPNWWLVTFFGTIIFGFIYYVHYTFGGGMTLAQELEVVMKSLPKAVEQAWNEDDLKSKMGGPEVLAKGQAVFTSKCAACHGAHGEGVIGPNLTDKFWIHGGQRADVMKVLVKGVTEKGMPAWVGMISDDEILHVAGFVYSLREKPVAGKAPQGEELK